MSSGLNCKFGKKKKQNFMNLYFLHSIYILIAHSYKKEY